MSCDLLIRDVLLAERGGERCDIALAGGSILAVGSGLEGPARAGSVDSTFRGEIDGRGLIAFPGLVDAHVHFNDPGRDHWEGARTGSLALAAGGATCYADMPLNSHPPTLTRAAFRAKRERLEERSIIDFALWGGLTPSNLNCLE
ncbi:MAG: allantoinase, partial [Spirochaetaceae bacterium]